MPIEPKLKPGQLVQATIAGDRYVGLVLSTRRALRRGMSPMIEVQWSGEPPRDYRVEHVEESLLRSAYS